MSCREVRQNEKLSSYLDATEIMTSKNKDDLQASLTDCNGMTSYITGII